MSSIGTIKGCWDLTSRQLVQLHVKLSFKKLVVLWRKKLHKEVTVIQTFLFSGDMNCIMKINEFSELYFKNFYIIYSKECTYKVLILE